MNRGSQRVTYQKKELRPHEALAPAKIHTSQRWHQVSRTSLTLVHLSHSLTLMGVAYKGPLTGPEQYAPNPPRGSPTHARNTA
jgi:hypothetical protein